MKKTIIGGLALLLLGCPQYCPPKPEEPTEPNPYITDEQEIRNRFIEGEKEQVDVSGALNYNPLNPLTKYLNGSLDTTLKQLDWARVIYLEEGDSLEQIATIANSYSDLTRFEIGEGEFNLDAPIYLFSPVQLVGVSQDKTTVNASLVGLGYLGIQGIRTEGNAEHNLHDVAPFFAVFYNNGELVECDIAKYGVTGFDPTNNNNIEGNTFHDMDNVFNNVAISFELSGDDKVNNSTTMNYNHFRGLDSVFFLKEPLPDGMDTTNNLFENCGTVVYNEKGEQTFIGNAWLVTED